MKKKIVRIDEDRCIGCGVCVNSCHQGAIAMVDGKARVVGENQCDGLGRCLGECPVDAIRLVEVEVEEPPKMACGCPGTLARQLAPRNYDDQGGSEIASRLQQWPVQLALVSPQAEYFRGADLLVSADCVPFACGDFHRKYLQGKVVVTFCPKLDGKNGEYAAKLAEIFRANDIRSVTVLRMEVPCCGGTVSVVERALEMAGKQGEIEVRIVGVSGEEK